MKRFEVLDHTADVGLKAYGRTLEELFLHAALGMFGLIADVTTIQPMASVPVLAQADDLEGLLVAWLRELLYAGGRDKMVFMNANIHHITPTAISGEATGEALDLERHTVYREIKAVTYHDVAVRQEGELWVAEVIFDI